MFFVHFCASVRIIYQYILSQSMKFTIMNDYERTVDIAGHRVTYVNSDTAVCSSLAARAKYCDLKTSPLISYGFEVILL